MDDDGQSTESSSDPPIAAYNAGAVGWIYRGISVAGIAMATGGVLVQLNTEGELTRGLVSVSDVPSAVLTGDPAAWTTLGIWVLLAGPALALISMFISGIRRRSWPAVALSVVVLVILILAVPAMSWLEGGG